MIIDCDSCQLRELACEDCVVGVLMATPAPDAGDDRAGAVAGGGAGAEREPLRAGGRTIPLPVSPSGAPIVQLDAAERRAIAILADQGLVPRLRLAAAPQRRTHIVDDGAHPIRDAG